MHAAETKTDGGKRRLFFAEEATFARPEKQS